MGFQRDNIPLAESRGRASGGVRGNNANNLSVIGIYPVVMQLNSCEEMANNLSVIGIYPAKKSNRNQKNNAQKESIGLCKKRIDKMEMPTKSK